VHCASLAQGEPSGIGAPHAIGAGLIPRQAPLIQTPSLVQASPSGSRAVQLPVPVLLKLHQPLAQSELLWQPAVPSASSAPQTFSRQTDGAVHSCSEEQADPSTFVGEHALVVRSQYWPGSHGAEQPGRVEQVPVQ